MDEIYKNYNFPEIKMEGLSKTEYEHRCKYLRLYFRIIDRCKNMTEEELSGYCEKHHILPRCMGGTDSKSNLIELPVRYHIMIHIVIIEAYPEIRGLRYAMLMITSDGNKNNQIYRKGGLKTFSTRFLAKIRENSIIKLRKLGKSEEHRRKLSEALTGRKIPREIVEKVASKLRGRKMPEEQRKRMSTLLKGKKRSPEAIKRNSESHKGKKIPLEVRIKMSISTSGEKNPMYGKPRSEETKRKISEKNKGGRNGMSKKVVGPDGTIYGCISEASIITGLSQDQISRRINGKTKDPEGWSSYKE